MSSNLRSVVIDASKRQGRTSLKLIWQYRDLLLLLVRRDFVAFYKQTVLGPIWFFFKPIFSAAVYLYVFGELAGLSTDGIPAPLFYISGITAWSYFSETVATISQVLISNAAIFGKVYFPRLIMPISVIFSNMFKLFIQIALILVIFLVYVFGDSEISFGINMLLLPFVIALIALQALGVGLFVASISTKYRDISMLIGYLLQLGLFISPVVFPLSSIQGKFRTLLALNPMTVPLELFKYTFFARGTITPYELAYSIVITAVLVSVGIFSFNRAEKTFVDTI